LTQFAALNGRQLVAILRTFGFETVRVRGSHYVLRHADGRSTVVPVHSNEDIGPGLLSKILRDTKLTREEIQPQR
jgi:predicted RNA binding protein YcfA (HicA-like mRNA interferase family)